MKKKRCSQKKIVFAGGIVVTAILFLLARLAAFLQSSNAERLAWPERQISARTPLSRQISSRVGLVVRGAQQGTGGTAGSQGFSYVGCFTDHKVNRDLPVYAEELTPATIISCYQHAAKNHFKFFAIQFGFECWVGQRFGQIGKSSACERCTSQSQAGQECGGALANSVYRVINSKHSEYSPEKEQEPATPDAAAAAAAKPLLLIGINTVPRPDQSTDYLSNTLQSLHAAIAALPVPSLAASPVKVLVMNCGLKGQHTHFEQNKKKYQESSAIMEFVNREEDASLSFASVDPVGKADRGGANKPGFRVRQQTRDIVAVMRAAEGRSQFYMFMEDDFIICPGALSALLYIPYKASLFDSTWISIRVGFGMNGFIVKNSRDLAVFGDFLLKHQARRPPDHLSVEWSAGESEESKRYKGDRPHMCYRYNLLQHIGSLSTLRVQKTDDSVDRCWEELIAPVLFDVEAFDSVACDHDDMTPCRDLNEGHQTIPPLFLLPAKHKANKRPRK